LAVKSKPDVTVLLIILTGEQKIVDENCTYFLAWINDWMQHNID